MHAVRPSPLPLSGFPHILRSIVDYADGPTALTLLRTSYQLFEIAGPEIYREVYLDHKTIGGIFLGANRNPPNGEPEPEKKHGDSTDAITKVEKGSSRALPGLEVGKRGLLKHIKIIHITAHRRTDCQPLASIVSSLLVPDVVRTVCPRTSQGSYDTHLCGTDPCPLLRRIDAKKLVFRNIDFWYWPTMDDDVVCMFKAPRQDEIVYFLPANGWYHSPSDQEAERIKLVIGENIEPSPWDWLGDVQRRCENYGSFSIDELVTDLGRSMRYCRELEIVGLETILLRDTTWPSRGEIITEEQLLAVKERLKEGLEKSSGQVARQLIFKTGQQYHREDNYGELRWEEKQRCLEEDKLGSASPNDTASSSHSGPDP